MFIHSLLNYLGSKANRCNCQVFECSSFATNRMVGAMSFLHRYGIEKFHHMYNIYTNYILYIHIVKQ